MHFTINVEYIKEAVNGTPIVIAVYNLFCLDLIGM